ncbi:OPT oligopeptide transporter domain containing protein [Elaphomyces granulatus]
MDSNVAAPGRAHATLEIPQPMTVEESGDHEEAERDIGNVADAANDDTPWSKQVKANSAQSFTSRSLFVGLLIGTLITSSNTYFGLQTGWISNMAMPSSLIGFAIFRALSKHLSFPFTPVENVLVQTVAGAVGTMPLGCGFIGVIPALEFLLREGEDGPLGGDGKGEGGPLNVGFWRLILWSLGVCLFGVVFAVPLRKEVIIREKLKFPSGTATAMMIRVLHGGMPASGGEDIYKQHATVVVEGETETLLQPRAPENAASIQTTDPDSNGDNRRDWKAKIRLLVWAFAISAFYTLFSYFVPQARNIPIFGLHLADKWLWALNPSPAYVGQGIIMGPSTTAHMFFGAILGWGVLSPLAKNRKWAPGPVDDWENGSKGWIVWISLAIMLADSITNLGWLVIKPLIPHAMALKSRLRFLKMNWRSRNRPSAPGAQSDVYYSFLGDVPGSVDNESINRSSEKDDAPPSQLISTRTVVILLPLTLILNVICMRIAFGNIMSPLLSGFATILALLLSIMGVRALGETDLNPVSGISKLTQLIFAFMTPASQHTRRSALVTNLLAGAVSESGALQAGDMMQDLKTGHLLGASPKAQFFGQLIGSLFGAIISTVVYKMYVNIYDVPGPMFQVPTAYVWIFTARLVTGQFLPPMAWQAATVAGGIFVVITILRIIGNSQGPQLSTSAPWRAWIPGGIAVAIGMYNVPSFTLARAIGGVIAWWSRRGLHKTDQDGDPLEDSGSPSTFAMSNTRKSGVDVTEDEFPSSTVIVLASGLILGEGVISILNLLLASAKVPHL